MKRFIALLLSLVMAFGFTACSDLGISEEALTSAVVGAIIDGIEDGLEESFSQSDDELENILHEESESLDEEKNEELIEDDEKVTPHETDTFYEDDGVSSHEGEYIEDSSQGEIDDETSQAILDEYGDYYSKEDVALYIHTYGKLPVNFITKDEAEDLGWSGGSVEKYGEGLAIGGDKFGNREGLLPKKSGRLYYECDIDTNGRSSRGAKRIVFSNDGLIYYTDDHYESFTLLYGEE